MFQLSGQLYDEGDGSDHGGTDGDDDIDNDCYNGEGDVITAIVRKLTLWKRAPDQCSWFGVPVSSPGIYYQSDLE